MHVTTTIQLAHEGRRSLPRREAVLCNAYPLSGKLEQRVRKRVVTTPFTYDNNGDVTQKTVDGTTTAYVWDYANRLIALGAGGSARE
jgi:uncharacterized protein RhaS with RHS repeats